jgi:ankyrin repeat protein
MATNYDDSMELIQAADGGNIHRVKELLDAGAVPNFRDVLHGGTALQAAAGGGYLEIVQLLVQKGADVNLSTGDIAQTPLESAAIAGHLAVVQWLLAHGAMVPEGPETDALIAELFSEGREAMAELLRKNTTAGT